MRQRWKMKQWSQTEESQKKGAKPPNARKGPEGWSDHALHQRCISCPNGSCLECLHHCWKLESMERALAPEEVWQLTRGYFVWYQECRNFRKEKKQLLDCHRQPRCFGSTQAQQQKYLHSLCTWHSEKQQQDRGGRGMEGGEATAARSK